MSCSKAKAAAILALTVGALAGCSKVVDKSGESAPFVVQKVEVASSLDSKSDANWNMPSAKSISFKACMQELAYLNAIKGHPFTVSGGGATEQTKTSDQSGCIIWTEELEYNFLAPETYVRLTRVIQAGSPYKGAQTIALAVDPWSASVIDTRFDATPSVIQPEEKRAQALRGDAAKSSQALLSVDSVSLNFGQANYTAKKAEIPIEISMSPVAVRTGIDGEGKAVPLAIGSFRLKIALIEKTPGVNGDERRLLGEKTWTHKMAKGVLTVSAPLTISEIPSPRSSFEMRFSLEAVDGPAGLASEEGILTFNFIKDAGSVKVTRTDEPMGAFVKQLRDQAKLGRKHLKGSLAPIPGDPARTAQDKAPAPNPSASPADAALLAAHPELGDAANSDPAANDCGYKDRSGGYLIDSVQINHAGFTDFSQDTKVPNEIAVSLIACVKNSLDLKPVTDFNYQVGLVAKATDAVKQAHDTDNAGCMHWSERIRFDYTQSDRWLPMYVKIQSANAPYVGVTKSLKVFINPWQVGWLHSWDCRSGEPPSKQDPEPAKLHVSDFQWNYTGRDFELDPSLRLKLTRKYRFQFRPLLVRKDSSLPTTTLEGSRDGKFHLKLVLLAGDQVPAPAASPVAGAATAGPLALTLNDALASRYLSHYEADVTTNNGLGVEEVKLGFMFRDLPLVASRNLMIIEVSPVEQGTSLQPVTVSAPVQTLDDQTYISYTPLDGVNVSDLISRGMKVKAHQDQDWRDGQALLKKSQNLQKLVGVVRLSTDEAKAAGLTREDIQVLTREPKQHPDLLKKFCVLYYADQAPDKLKDKFWKSIGDKLWGLAGKAPLSNFSDLTNCVANPADFLTAGSGQHVEKLLSQPTEVRGDTFGLTLSAVFTKAGSYSTYQGKSMGFELSAGMESSLLGKRAALESGAQIESYMGIRVDQGQTSSQNVSTFRALTGEQMDLEFDAETRNCLHVSGKSRSLAPMRFTCVDSAPPQRQRLRESWYYLAQVTDFHSTPLRDPHLLQERSWIKLIRGGTQFNAFKSMVEDKDNQFVLVPWNVVNDIKKAGTDVTTKAAENFNRNTMVEDGGFPGLILE